MVATAQNIDRTLWDMEKSEGSPLAALGLAIIYAWNKTQTSAAANKSKGTARPEVILKDPQISNALSVLPISLKEELVAWFQKRTEAELAQAHSFINESHRTQENLVNILGEHLFTDGESKLKGAVFTPPWLSRYLSQIALKHWRRLNPGKGYPTIAGDLSCGPGIFLSSLLELLPRETQVVGYDSCPEYVCLARLLNIRSEACLVKCADTLIEMPTFRQMDLFAAAPTLSSSSFDLIVGNPPYIRSQLLNRKYARTLKQLYPDMTQGNFDLVVLFLAQTLNLLAPGGIAALVVSSKFMASRYGREICKRLGTTARILEILDFGDGQVFSGKTTYTCTIVFAYLPPAGSCTVVRFPPGLRWDKQGTHLTDGETTQVPSERFQNLPWDLTGGTHENILHLMRQPRFPRLSDVFPQISQGIRTGANNIFVLRENQAHHIEKELLYPYVSGENIRRCQLVATTKFLLWPYKHSLADAVVILASEELESKYPQVWEYLQEHRTELSKRDLEAGTPWYGYSRSQNLELQRRPKILVREMMPWAEFATDCNGEYALCSGYALVAPQGMSIQELRLWAAILSTPTMEFQIRYTATQLHSGWFRVLKHHLKRLRVICFSEEERKKACRLADSLHQNPDDETSWDELDKMVAGSFGLSPDMRDAIRQHLDRFHEVSNPNRRGSNRERESSMEIGDYTQDEITKSTSNLQYKNDETNLSGIEYLSDLTNEQRRRFYPIELPQFYSLHRDKESLRQLVTFVSNKTAPIHRWYKFTQGYSGELVRRLIDDLQVKKGAIICDPFVGSGTTLLTCRILGFDSFGAEISPLMAWVSRLKVHPWEVTELRQLVGRVKRAQPKPSEPHGMLFPDYFEKAFAPEILKQVVGWRDWIITQDFEPQQRDFLLLGLVSILEEVSNIRKHGSHYRFLNNLESVGLTKLNIPVIDSSTDLKPIVTKQLESMIVDIETVTFAKPLAFCEVYLADSRTKAPNGSKADFVITSPPYLNRNNYIAQQKAEMSILGLLPNFEAYRKLVRSTFRSHVECSLERDAKSVIPEVNNIVSAIELTENNNAKIPHMVCGYFDDLQQTLITLRQLLNPGAKLAFVVGNSRWGGVVVPVDHLLALIAQRLGYKVECIYVTRLKGNSPQQMRRYGRIPLRESIVIVQWPG
jgi:methylase of polypeptide subunit release factors